MRQITAGFGWRLHMALTVVGIFTLSGCADLDQALKDIQKAGATPAKPAPTLIDDTLPQICQAAKDNPVKANEQYVNRGMSIRGEVRNIRESFQPRYRIYMVADQINVHAGTDNSSEVLQLKTGTTTTAIGIIENVSYDFNGCAVQLIETSFKM